MGESLATISDNPQLQIRPKQSVINAHIRVPIIPNPELSAVWVGQPKAPLTNMSVIGIIGITTSSFQPGINDLSL